MYHELNSLEGRVRAFGTSGPRRARQARSRSTFESCRADGNDCRSGNVSWRLPRVGIVWVRKGRWTSPFCSRHFPLYLRNFYCGFVAIRNLCAGFVRAAPLAPQLTGNRGQSVSAMCTPRSLLPFGKSRRVHAGCVKIPTLRVHPLKQNGHPEGRPFRHVFADFRASAPGVRRRRRAVRARRDASGPVNEARARST